MKRCLSVLLILCLAAFSLTAAAEGTFLPVGIEGADVIASATSKEKSSSNKTSSTIEEGMLVSFGHYPQTSSGSDDSQIVWMVLKVDYRNEKALLLSKYGLDAKKFNTEAAAVTWESCSLRDWLNIAFYDAAFTDDEKSIILREEVTGLGDYLYLLTYDEAIAYMPTNDDGLVTAPTDYAFANGAYRSNDYFTADGEKAGQWWTRDTDTSSKSGYVVTRSGSKYRTKVNYVKTKNSSHDQKVTVRPALWIDLSMLE